MTKENNPAKAVNPKKTTSGHVFKKIHKGSGSSVLIEKILKTATRDEGKRAQTIHQMVNNLNMTLKCKCADCSYSWTFEKSELLNLCKEDDEMKDLKVDCPKCKSKAIISHPVSIL